MLVLPSCSCTPTTHSYLCSVSIGLFLSDQTKLCRLESMFLSHGVRGSVQAVEDELSKKGIADPTA